VKLCRCPEIWNQIFLVLQREFEYDNGFSASGILSAADHPEFLIS
jgi:hypothetical protein